MKKEMCTRLFLGWLSGFIVAIVCCCLASCGGDDKKSTQPTGPLVKVTAAKIDLTNKLQIIRGFGAATVFVPTVPLSSGELDLLFGKNTGQIGLSMLRIRLASDDDSNWRNLELSNAKGAVARGAIVFATPWSPPVRMKTNNSLINGSLKPESYADFATYLNDFANYMEANGAPLYAVSVQNEPDFVPTYESCAWSAVQMHDFLKNNGGAITSTRVIAPESYNFNHTMSDPTLSDDQAATNVDIIGGHIYGAGIADYPLARTKGKELWMTEHLDTATRWSAVLATGKEIHDCLTVGNFNAYVWWYAKRFYGPLSESGTVTKRGFVMSSFAKFVRPGYYRVSAATTMSNIYVSAYVGDKVVLVIINANTVPIDQQFVIRNGTVSSFKPYVTSQTQDFEAGTSISITDSLFTQTLPAQSITTLVQE